VVPDAPAVLVDGLSKTFMMPRERAHTFKERALHPLRRTAYDELRALRDVSFEVEHGEFFGIVGRNGSGKSTLLKCMAGIYGTDTGDIYVNGRMSTFIELGVGFNPDLAARDNAMLNAIMLGLSKRGAEDRYERILDFSELHEFEDLKIKNYSSGMLVRLAFSVMIQVDADILLIDEVLAVGDAAFQQKCYDEFNRLRDEKRTILFVTHDMASVERFCHRALLLDRGEVVTIDRPGRVAQEYFRLNFDHREQQVAPDAPPHEEGRRGDGGAEVLEGWFEDERGERADTLEQHRPCSYCARIRFHEPAGDPKIGAIFEDAEHRPVWTTTSAWHDEHTGEFAAGEEVVFRLSFENAFAPGRYWVHTGIARRGAGEDTMDRRDRLASVLVTGVRGHGGVVDVPHDLRIERQASRTREPA
jgi:ABC-type polysaccharide/polyol phosphate transport system ATPase subunit